MYRVTFPIQESNAALILDIVADKVAEWVNFNDLVSTRESVPHTAISTEHVDIGNSVSFESVRVDLESESNWVCRFSHPDRESPSLRWTTEIGVSRNSGTAFFSCSNLVGNLDGTLAPIRRYTTRPRIVETILGGYPASGPFNLSTKPIRLQSTSAEVNGFIDFLEAPERRYPVVFISTTNQSDQPLVDPARVASSVCGLAHVYVAHNRFCSMGLRDRMPNDLNCWDGGVRIYWPGFQQTDFPLRHRLWVPWRVREINAQPGYFNGYLLGLLSNLSAYSHHPQAVTWDSVQAAQRRAGLAKAKASGDWEQMATAYSEDNDKLREQVVALQAQLDQRGIEIEQKASEAEQWRLAYQQAKSGSTVETPVETPVTSVAEAIERATRNYGDRLAFALNSNSDSDTPFSDPEEVERAFQFLATTYYFAKVGSRPCHDLNHAIRESIGAHWFYQGGQSQITMTSHPGWYQCLYGSAKIWLGEHIGTGVSKDARQTVRIGFTWIEADKKAVIGFIGQHQKSGKT
jgi:hypothetical protein